MKTLHIRLKDQIAEDIAREAALSGQNSAQWVLDRLHERFGVSRTAPQPDPEYLRSRARRLEMWADELEGSLA